MKILVAYASRHGATKGIAEHIAGTLERAGLDVTLEAVENTGAVDQYDAFVVGSAAYMGGWMGEATAFVRRHQFDLVRRPVWLFSSGPIGTETVDAKGRNQIEASYDPDAEPVGTAEGLMARFTRLAPAVRNALPAGDFRDWPEIERWAEWIARELQPVGAKV